MTFFDLQWPDDLALDCILPFTLNEGRGKEAVMEVFGLLGFVFGLLAFLRVEKLIKNLKQQGVLHENYKAD